MNIIKAIYNFIVGDMVILIGIIVTVLILVLLNTVSGLSALRGASGIIMILGTLTVLTLTLTREVRGHRAR
ncbi:hypothetical protein [Dictyobacter aurantiacus]|uniref:Uncharacterized protein n=1 Tax=Dictyobacter aurantiacus TaxID=1936993 RepID=A0A401ZL57_9CHLR|nr:hypothetical protein [Dictyobacter aurantiacus]GCE07621.1 hypothetical protein KDAU_49500 [Dictyobacter aurantiacus]